MYRFIQILLEKDTEKYKQDILKNDFWSIPKWFLVLTPELAIYVNFIGFLWDFN